MCWAMLVFLRLFQPLGFPSHLLWAGNCVVLWPLPCSNKTFQWCWVYLLEKTFVWGCASRGKQLPQPRRVSTGVAGRNNKFQFIDASRRNLPLLRRVLQEFPCLQSVQGLGKCLQSFLQWGSVQSTQILLLAQGPASLAAHVPHLTASPQVASRSSSFFPDKWLKSEEKDCHQSAVWAIQERILGHI